MPHRDPETGQFVGGDGGAQALSYADHDVHHIRHQISSLASSGGDDVTQTVEEEFEVTERGLDPDELAELRAMRVSIGTVAKAGQPQDSRGEFAFQVDAGFNIGESDALFSSNTTARDLDPDADGTDEVRSRVAETDEVGQVYTHANSVGIGFDDDANGNGAGGQGVTVTETVDLAGMFGTGPFVDSADDFVSVATLSPDNVIEFFGVEIAYSLYYNVETTEGGRSRFGR